VKLKMQLLSSQSLIWFCLLLSCVDVWQKLLSRGKFDAGVSSFRNFEILHL
jgi:hypothetical protein